jgi:hypothetical protein
MVKLLLSFQHVVMCQDLVHADILFHALPGSYRITGNYISNGPNRQTPVEHSTQQMMHSTHSSQEPMNFFQNRYLGHEENLNKHKKIEIIPFIFIRTE